MWGMWFWLMRQRDINQEAHNKSGFTFWVITLLLSSPMIDMPFSKSPYNTRLHKLQFLAGQQKNLPAAIKKTGVQKLLVRCHHQEVILLNSKHNYKRIITSVKWLTSFLWECPIFANISCHTRPLSAKPVSISNWERHEIILVLYLL